MFLASGLSYCCSGIFLVVLVTTFLAAVLVWLLSLPSCLPAFLTVFLDACLAPFLAALMSAILAAFLAAFWAQFICIFGIPTP